MTGPTFTLYARLGCHLCEDMQHQLQSLQAERPFALEVVDIDSDPALEAQYGTRVPVLLSGETEICQYFLDKQALLQYF
ncbi:MAG: glutaredoxin family protein [Thioalkalispiraceae bacterium]